MEHFKDENLNTLNLPHINKNQKTQVSNMKFQFELDTSQMIYKMAILNLNREIVSEDFYDLVRNIIEKNDIDFLTGDSSLIETLITKYTNITTEQMIDIKKLTFKVVENFSFLNEFGIHLQNLEQLNLENSKIKSISEIGSSFENLIDLNISNCGLIDLSGKNLF